jgi:hypothetical protein
MQLKWWSSIRPFNQIWLQTRYESRKKKKVNPSMLLATYWNLLIMKNWWFGNLFVENLVNFSHYFPWKILCLDRNHIIQVEIWQNFAQKLECFHAYFIHKFGKAFLWMIATLALVHTIEKRKTMMKGKKCNKDFIQSILLFPVSTQFLHQAHQH